MGYFWVDGSSRARTKRRLFDPATYGSLTRAQEVVGFIRSRWVRLLAPWASLGLSGVVSFSPSCPRCLCVHLVSLS